MNHASKKVEVHRRRINIAHQLVRGVRAVAGAKGASSVYASVYGNGHPPTWAVYVGRGGFSGYGGGAGGVSRLQQDTMLPDTSLLLKRMRRSHEPF
jgi:hypothetical protein